MQRQHNNDSIDPDGVLTKTWTDKTGNDKTWTQ